MTTERQAWIEEQRKEFKRAGGDCGLWESMIEPLVRNAMAFADASRHHEQHGDMDGKTCLLASCPVHYPHAPPRQGGGERLLQCAAIRQHELKCWPEFYAAIIERSKTFEVRKNDRDFHEGDLLVLQEFNPETNHYTGRSSKHFVTYVTQFGQPSGQVVMSIFPQDSSTTPPAKGGGEAKCQCTLSDAWRCAKQLKLRTVACHCSCHRKTTPPAPLVDEVVECREKYSDGFCQCASKKELGIDRVFLDATMLSVNEGDTVRVLVYAAPEKKGERQC